MIPLDDAPVAIGSDFFDAPFAVCNMGYRSGAMDGWRHCLARTIKALTKEVSLDTMRQVPLRLHDVLCFETRKRCIVLMHTMHRHAIRRRSNCRGHDFPPLDMGFVEQPCPVDRADYHRASRAKQYRSDGFQRIFDELHGCDPPHRQRCRNRRQAVSLLPFWAFQSTARLRKKWNNCAPRISPIRSFMDCVR